MLAPVADAPFARPIYNIQYILLWSSLTLGHYNSLVASAPRSSGITIYYIHYVHYSARFARCVNTIMIHIYKITNYSLEKRDNRESIHINIYKHNYSLNKRDSRELLIINNKHNYFLKKKVNKELTARFARLRLY